jgi:3-oxoacyl-[acyl-carrier-protein] synthase-3
MAYIKAISYYLPESILSNKQINEEFPEWGIDKIAAKTGIDNRHISADDEFSSDMAIKAAGKLFAEHTVDKNDIDFLLLCTQSPDYILPTTACIVQDKLGLATTVGALDFNLGCSGFVYGLSLAKGLIAAGMAKKVLLITSETYSKFIHSEDKSNKTIFGDGASATLIDADNGFFNIGDFVFGTDGSGAENLIVKEGGRRYPAQSHSEDFRDEYNNVRNFRNLYMNGAAIFNFTNETVPKLIQMILDKSKLSFEEINLFVFHQANKYMLNHLKKKLKVPEDKFFLHIKDCGNTVSSTIPIALYEAQRENKFLMNDKIVLAGFGVGYSWAACILKVTSI